MKLRPTRLPSSSTIEANGTSDQNDHRNDDTAKTKLGSLWRKAKREALSLSPRVKTIDDLLPNKATVAPVVVAVDDSKEVDSMNTFPSSSNADAVSSPRVKRKQSPSANDDCALLKHRLPKKQSKTESPSRKNVEPSTIRVPPVEANATTEETQVTGGRPPTHPRRSTNSSRHSSSAVTKHPTSPLSESSKTSRASPKMHSQNSSCSITSRGSTRKILSPANTQHSANRTKQDERAVSATSDAASMVTANKGETTSASLKINSQDSSCSKTSRSRTKKTLSSVSNQKCANDAMQEKRAVSGISDTASTATAKKDGGEKKKTKSALQQFREDEAAKALERARMKEDVKEIETKQRLEDEKNGRWWLLEGLGVGL
ncbi:hypothetical protein HJC23_003396 [Cyclotella cryptica]|uniref:Uncharacterized protein n=1 Tax=Cyclotella cryptica TaxID=29204 RepID=A0ABD3NUJ5_9STRA